MADRYTDMDAAQRKKWRAANPQDYVNVVKVNDVLYKYKDAETTTATTKSTPAVTSDAGDYQMSTIEYAEKRAQAAGKFGTDILALADQYAAVPEAQRTAWRKAHPGEYARLQPYWDFMYGRRAGTGTGASTGRSSTYYPPPLVRRGTVIQWRQLLQQRLQQAHAGN